VTLSSCKLAYTRIYFSKFALCWLVGTEELDVWMSNDELGLIQRAQRGDAAACAALYDRHYDAVYRYCYYRVGDVALAQDVASEVFVRMVEKLDSFKPRGRPLLAWLYTIARNLIADSHRRQGRTTHLPLDEALTVGQESLTQDVERSLLADCLRIALRHLTEDQRQVILLKFMENHTNAQVARMLRKTEGSIKSLQHRALGSLRRALERERCYEA
jgi:RNA polymerase sigma-70 factor (ECF subfamily)